jgi:hypothetical protein
LKTYEEEERCEKNGECAGPVDGFETGEERGAGIMKVQGEVEAYC